MKMSKSEAGKLGAKKSKIKSNWPIWLSSDKRYSVKQCGWSVYGYTSVFQTEIDEFEPRLPLQKLIDNSKWLCYNRCKLRLDAWEA